MNILDNGALVSRISDFIIYAVEAERIDSVVEMFAHCKYCMSTWCDGCNDA